MSLHHSPDWLRARGKGVPLAGHLLPGAGPLGRLVHAFAEHRQRAREREELYAMSFRELRDIGLTRGDIERVLDGSFVREDALCDRCAATGRDR